jgi:hypothetical protein
MANETGSESIIPSHPATAFSTLNSPLAISLF